MDGLLLVDKPAGLTSHDVVALVRRVAHTKRVGHAGTLDPFATGLLVLLIGRGTRLLQYVEGEPKIYLSRIHLGAETETDDLTGAVMREAPAPDDVAIAAAIPRLTGEIDQVPPAYSAKQVDGRRAYAAARRGSPLDLPPARVSVKEWQIVAREGNDLVARITCGSGTYIRALARDLGRLTGSAAHLTSLRRERSGPFDVGDAVSVEDLKNGAFSLQPLIAAIPSFATYTLNDAELRRVLHGNVITLGSERGAREIVIPSEREAREIVIPSEREARVEGPPSRRRSHVALVDTEQRLIAVAEEQGNELKPKLVLRDA